jgi:hypothetical protein
MLKSFPDLRPAAKAHIAFMMGAGLCDLGKYDAGNRLLWKAVGYGLVDIRAGASSFRAFGRIVRQMTGMQVNPFDAARNATAGEAEATAIQVPACGGKQ